MPFLSRNIDQIGKDASGTGLQASPEISKTGTLVERLSSFYATRGKHLFDAIAAFFLIIIFAPLMALIAILIKLTSRGYRLFLTRAGWSKQRTVCYPQVSEPPCGYAVLFRETWCD